MDHPISVRQTKTARALLAWSQGDLATASGISGPTIARLEAEDGRSETGQLWWWSLWKRLVSSLFRAVAAYTNISFRSLVTCKIEFTSTCKPGLDLILENQNVNGTANRNNKYRRC